MGHLVILVDFEMIVPALLQTIGYNTFFSHKPAPRQDLNIAHALGGRDVEK